MASGRETVLLVTADEMFAQALEKHLTQNGYDVTVIRDVVSGMTSARRILPALVLMDRRQPVAEVLRREPVLHRVPLITVQPPGVECSQDECAQDFEHDVDLVVCSPSYRELIARIRAVLRGERMRAALKCHYMVGGLRLDVERHEVTVNGQPVELTPKEFQILEQFLLHPSRVLSRDELLNRVWGEGCALEEHTLDVHIHSLRHKIEADPAHPRYIVTVRGVGYKLTSG